MTSLHDTTGHVRYPGNWEPCRFLPTHLVSPSGTAAYLSEPSGFPRTAQVSPAYAFRLHPGPPPVRRLTPRGSPVSVFLLARAPLWPTNPVAVTRTPHPTRFQSSVRGARVWRAVPVGSRAVPHRMFPTSMYRPELCARPGFQPEGLPPVPPPPKPRGPGTFCGPAGFPTPRVYSRASALGLWGTGNRVPRFPDHRWWGKMNVSPHHPRPHFRNTQPEHRSPDLSGSPNHQSPGSPPGMWIGLGSSNRLSAIALPVECRASPHFLRHAASPAT